jgi:transposase
MSIDEWGIAKDELVFQHDNDPKHTTKITKAYLEAEGLTEVQGMLLYWPAQPPDLNSIEHIWAHLNIKLEKYSTRPTSCEELWKQIVHEWYSIPAEFCRKLIHSMPDRIAAVYKAHGKQTKY